MRKDLHKSLHCFKKTFVFTNSNTEEFNMPETTTVWYLRYQSNDKKYLTQMATEVIRSFVTMTEPVHLHSWSLYFLTWRKRVQALTANRDQCSVKKQDHQKSTIIVSQAYLTGQSLKAIPGHKRKQDDTHILPRLPRSSITLSYLLF